MVLSVSKPLAGGILVRLSNSAGAEETTQTMTGYDGTEVVNLDNLVDLSTIRPYDNTRSYNRGEAVLGRDDVDINGDFLYPTELNSQDTPILFIATSVVPASSSFTAESPSSTSLANPWLAAGSGASDLETVEYDTASGTIIGASGGNFYAPGDLLPDITYANWLRDRITALEAGTSTLNVFDFTSTDPNDPIYTADVVIERGDHVFVRVQPDGSVSQTITSTAGREEIFVRTGGELTLDTSTNRPSVIGVDWSRVTPFDDIEIEATAVSTEFDFYSTGNSLSFRLTLTNASFASNVLNNVVVGNDAPVSVTGTISEFGKVLTGSILIPDVHVRLAGTQTISFNNITTYSFDAGGIVFISTDLDFSTDDTRAFTFELQQGGAALADNVDMSLLPNTTISAVLTSQSGFNPALTDSSLMIANGSSALVNPFSPASLNIGSNTINATFQDSARDNASFTVGVDVDAYLPILYTLTRTSVTPTDLTTYSRVDGQFTPAVDSVYSLPGLSIGVNDNFLWIAVPGDTVAPAYQGVVIEAIVASSFLLPVSTPVDTTTNNSHVYHIYQISGLRDNTIINALAIKTIQEV